MEIRFPSLSDRIQSTMIDGLLLIGLSFITARVLDGYNNVPDYLRIGIFSFLFLLYEPLLVSTGCTVGQLAKGIRVRQNQDPTRRINFLFSLVRYLFKVLLGFVSFFTIHSNPKRRAIHDLASDSVMIVKN